MAKNRPPEGGNPPDVPATTTQHQQSGPYLQDFIDTALAQVGDPYVWADEGPNGFDCSGLVYYSLRQAGLNVPRLTANGYYNKYGNVARQNLKPGDLLFFNYGRLGSGQADHTAIYLGDGKMVAASSSAHHVAIQSVDWSHYLGATRVTQLKGTVKIPDNVATTKAPVGPNPPGAPDVGRGDALATLRSFGLDPADFSGLIDQAVREGWSSSYFESQVYLMPAFRSAFQGIFRDDGTLKMTPAQYLQTGDEYKRIARNAGIFLDRDREIALFEGDNSPDEFTDKAEVFHAVHVINQNGIKDDYERVWKLNNIKPLSNQDWFDVIAEQSFGKVEDVYETSYLQNAGLDIGSGKGLGLAGQLGAPGEKVDLATLVANIRKVKAFVDPELAAAGISDTDLTLLEGGQDSKGLRPVLEQILNNRANFAGQTRVSDQPGALPGRSTAFAGTEPGT